jgi:hypothetical protein
MLLTHFIWQTDLKPLSVTNAKNGAIPPSLTPTMHIIHARCYKASEWVGGSLQCRRGMSWMNTGTATGLVLTPLAGVKVDIHGLHQNGRGHITCKEGKACVLTKAHSSLLKAL